MSKAKADELFLRWAKKEAVPIELDWTSSLTSFASDLFDSQLCGKKIVFLGEPDHFVVEKYQYQLLFIRRLRELGWNLIGREIGRSDGDRINRFVQSGDESYLNSVQLYGASDSNCAVSRMCPEGLMSPVAGSGVCDFLSVEFQFARALRDLAKLRDNESSIRFFGFDIDVFPGGAYTDIAELLAKSTDSSVSTQLLFDLVPRLGEKLSEEVIRLEQASKRAQLLTRSLEKSIGIDETNSLVATLKNWLSSVKFLERAFLNPTIDELWAAFAHREQSMIREVDLLIEKANSENLVLIGHNLHLTKNSDQIKSFDLCGQQVSMWPSIGMHVAKQFREQVLSVWMLCGQGTHSGPHHPSVQQTFSNLDRGVEAILSKVPCPTFLLPLANAPNIVSESLSEIEFGCNGQPAKGSLSDQVDMIFFVRQVTAL